MLFMVSAPRVITGLSTVGLVNLGVMAGAREWPLHLHAEETAGQCGSQVGRPAGQATAAFLTADSGSHDGEQG